MEVGLTYIKTRAVPWLKDPSTLTQARNLAGTQLNAHLPIKYLLNHLKLQNVKFLEGITHLIMSIMLVKLSAHLIIILINNVGQVFCMLKEAHKIVELHHLKDNMRRQTIPENRTSRSCDKRLPLFFSCLASDFRWRKTKTETVMFKLCQIADACEHKLGWK